MSARGRDVRRAVQARSEARATESPRTPGLLPSSKTRRKTTGSPELGSSPRGIRTASVEIYKAIGVSQEEIERAIRKDPRARSSVMRVSALMFQISDVKVPDPYAGQKKMSSRPEAADPGHADGNRKAITKFSDASRRALVHRFLRTDFEPMLAQGSLLAMVTLTYPGEWESVAFSSTIVKKHLSAWRLRFGRAFGYSPAAVWKMEYQRRGAPHFHILMAIPESRSKKGIPFPEWLSKSWANVVNHPDAEQKQLHTLAGTAIDTYSDKWTSFDRRKAAWYFAKHGAFKGSKEYQHIVPEIVMQNGGPGRFWGFWGLHEHTIQVPIAREHQIDVDRIIRRYHRAQGRTYRPTYGNRSSLWIDSAPELAARIARSLERGPRHVIRASLVSSQARQRYWIRSVSLIRQALQAWPKPKSDKRREFEFLDAYCQQEFGQHLIEHPLWLARSGLVSHPIYRELIEIELRGNRSL